jgi:protocatechuate 3,4-dioxygenase beta subunit
VVRDKAGQAVPDVRVRAVGFTRATAEIDGIFQQPGELALSYSEVTQQTMTDREGRFTLRHMPPDYRVGLEFVRPGFSRNFLFLDTNPNNIFTQLGTSGGRGGSFSVQRSPLRVTVEAGRFARIKVLDHAGQPVREGGVEMIDGQRHFAGQEPVNPDGEALLAIREPGRYELHFGTDPLRPRLSTSVKLDLKPGEDSPVVEIRLPEFRWQTGRVVDADTGKGVAGVHIHYGRKAEGAAGDVSASSMCVSGADGGFRIPVAAGPGSLLVARPTFGYWSLIAPGAKDRGQLPRLAIDVPKTGDAAPVTLSLSHGLAVKGIVRDADGKPVANAVVHVQSEGRAYRQATALTSAEGRYEAAGLSPREGAILTASSPGGFVWKKIDADPNHPGDRTRWQELDVRLERGVTLTGRVLFQGQPRAGVVLKLSRTLGEVKNRFYFLGQVRTDAQGRYRVHGLAAGDRYHFEVVDADGLADPDWHHQSPYLQTVREGLAEVALPDLKLKTRGQSLRGVVVDPQGKPVAGVSVSARLGSGRSLSRPASGPPPWTTTDDQGRFALHQLPDEPIELMAYHNDGRGGRVLYPSISRPKMNQQDIRIVFDPSLSEPIEDLDAPKKPGEKE